MPPLIQLALNGTETGGTSGQKINDAFTKIDFVSTALRGAWSGALTYAIGDIVSRDSGIYIANIQNVGQDPTSTVAWDNPLIPKVRDFDAWDGQTDFTVVGEIITTAYVYVNGVKVRSLKYSLIRNGVNTILKLNQPAVLNQWVSIEF